MGVSDCSGKYWAWLVDACCWSGVRTCPGAENLKVAGFSGAMGVVKLYGLVVESDSTAVKACVSHEDARIDNVFVVAEDAVDGVICAREVLHILKGCEVTEDLDDGDSREGGQGGHIRLLSGGPLKVSDLAFVRMGGKNWSGRNPFALRGGFGSLAFVIWWRVALASGTDKRVKEDLELGREGH